MNVLALDPGRTTGYAQGVIKDRTMLVMSGQKKFDHITLYDFIESINPRYIICERFEFRHGIHRHHGADMYSRELIGIVELYTKRVNDCELFMQPAMKDSPTTFFNNKRLKDLGIYKVANDHANDAARHLLYWAKFKFGSQLVDNYKTGVLS